MSKVILVTGSAKGIGASCIKKFALEGYNVIIHYLKSEKRANELENWVKENTSSKVLTVQCDITKEEEIQNMIQKIVEKFDHIDVLVNNAALEITTEFQNKTKQDFLSTLDTNLVGTFLVSKYVSKFMLENKKGNIVNITSNNAINQYDPSTLEYDASKAGIIGFTKSLAKEIASRNILVNAVAPGFIETNMTDVLKDDVKQEIAKNIPLKRMGTTQDVANVVKFLASDDSSYITGQVINVDGGMLM